MRAKRCNLNQAAVFEVHSQVTSAFAFFFDLCHPVPKKANIESEHNQLVQYNLIFMFDVTCEQGLISP